MSLDDFAEDFGLDDAAFEELMADVKADYNRDLANDFARVSTELKQAEESIAAFQVREQHFSDVMARQQSELQRLESQMATTTLSSENYKMENCTLVHHNIQLEADLTMLQKTCAMKDAELARACTQIEKYKKIATDLSSVMRAASERIIRDAQHAHLVSVALADEIEGKKPATAPPPQYLIVVDTTQPPPPPPPQ